MSDNKFESSDFEGTFWTVFDGDFYVSTIGSDIEGIGDGSPQRPFLTVKKAFDLSADNEKIIVGPDEYVSYNPNGQAPSGAWAPCRVATTGQQDLTIGLATVDGVTLLEGDCVLVWQQTNPTENGIYVVTTGNWARAENFDTEKELIAGQLVPVAEGTAHGKTIFQYVTSGTVVLGVSAIAFEKAAITDWGSIQGEIIDNQDLSDALDAKADKSNVLELDNTTSFIPENDYHPATKKFVEDFVAVLNKATPKGLLDCSANPNYLAGVVGDYYYVSVAGKIGGTSGVIVEQFDKIQCIADVAAGDQAAVGDSWIILQGNLDKATQTEAEAGTDNEKYMTALRAKEGWEYWNENEDVLSLSTNSKQLVGAINELANASIALTNGNGTTANGSSIGLGGNFDMDFSIESSNGSRGTMKSVDLAGAFGTELRFDETQIVFSFLDYNNELESAFRLKNTGLEFFDNFAQKGIVYGDDYSENYTNRSLVDKAYVDGLFGGIPTLQQVLESGPNGQVGSSVLIGSVGPNVGSVSLFSGSVNNDYESYLLVSGSTGSAGIELETLSGSNGGYSKLVVSVDNGLTFETEDSQENKVQVELQQGIINIEAENSGGSGGVYLDDTTYEIYSEVPMQLSSDGGVIIQGLTYPEVGGTNGQVLATNGAGVLSFASISAFSVNNEANNRVITSSGTGTGNAESNLTFDGTTLDINGALNVDNFYFDQGVLDVSSDLYIRRSSSNRLRIWSLGVVVYGDLESSDSSNLGSGSQRWDDLYLSGVIDASTSFKINNLASGILASDDLVMIQDADDSNIIKTVTAQSIADLASGGGSGFNGSYTVDDASTNTSIKIAEFNRTTSGTAADGIGGYLDLGVEDGAGSIRNLRFEHILSSVDATPNSFFNIYGFNESSTESLLLSLTQEIFMGRNLSIGTFGVAIGRNITAGSTSATFGFNSSTGNSGVAFGYYAQAGAAYSSSAYGSNTTANADYATALGALSTASGKGSLAVGRSSVASAQGAFMIGYDDFNSPQENSLLNSFELSWNGTRGFKTGLTLGTQVLVDADPDTNLTDAENGSIAYDSTDHEFRAYVNGSWTVLGGSGGSSGVLQLGSSGQIPTMNSSSSDFEYSDSFRYENEARLIAKGQGIDSVAIGKGTTSAGGANSIALGINASVSQYMPNGIAIGAFSQVSTSDVGLQEGGIAIGRATQTLGHGSIIMGYHTTTQQNSLSNSFKLMWNGQTGFHTGLTLGTQVLVDADPDTNLTDAENGAIAYDSTDHEFRAYVNGAWTSLSGTGGGSGIAKSGTPTANQLATWLDGNTIQGSSKIVGSFEFKESTDTWGISINGSQINNIGAGGIDIEGIRLSNGYISNPYGNDIVISENILPNSDGSLNIGSSTVSYNDFYIKGSIEASTSFKINNLASGTLASDDLVMIQDVNDSNIIKTVTAQSIADLASGGGLVNLNDSGADIVSTPSGTGTFVWNTLEFSDAIIHSKSTSGLQLRVNNNLVFNSNGASIIIEKMLVPRSDHSVDLGSSGRQWRDFYLNRNFEVTSNFKINNLASGTLASDDLVMIQDVNDSNIIKTVTAQSIADMASGGGSGFNGTYAVDDASTNTSIKIAEFNRTTSGTVADGIGGYMEIGIEDNNGDIASMSLEHILSSVDNLSRNSIISIKAYKSNIKQDFLVLNGNSTFGDYGARSISLGTGAKASFFDTIAIGTEAFSAGSGSISIGKGSGDASGASGNYHTSIGYNANGKAGYNIGNSSIAIGSATSSVGLGSIAVGNYSESTAQGAILMGFHTTYQENSLTDSFKLMWDGETVFHVGKTLGTQVTVSTDPDTNLTDAENGSIAYDSTDHEFRAYVNGGWTALGGGSSGGKLNLGSPTTLTISNGEITITGSNHTVDTESSASTDDLVTISGGEEGDILFLSPANDNRTIRLAQGGNIKVVGQSTSYFSMDHSLDSVLLVYKAGFWTSLSNSNNEIA